MNPIIRTASIGLMLVPSLLQAASSSNYQTLKDIYEQAQLHDPTWTAARYANTAAQEKLEQGKSLLRPTIGLSGSATHSDTDIRYTGSNSVFRNNNQSEKFDTVNYGLNINQPLYRKQNLVQYQQSAIQVSYADLQLQQDQQDLIIKSAQAYFDVLLAQDKIELNQAQKIAINSQLLQAKANYKAGVSTITDVDEAQAKFDVVQSQEIAAANDLENKKQAVQILTGQYPGAFYPIKENCALTFPNLPNQATNSPYPKIDIWLQHAQQNNIQINLKKFAYALADKEVELYQAGHLPTLDAVASYNKTNANGGVNGFGNDLNNTTVGFQFQLPLYQGGAVSSKIREAIANKDKAQQEIEIASRKAELDTKQAYLDITSSISQVLANEQTLRSSQSQLSSTLISFKVGLRTNVDVLNAQQQVFNAKRDLLQTRYSYLLGLLKLKYASGILSESDLEEINNQLISGQ